MCGRGVRGEEWRGERRGLGVWQQLQETFLIAQVPDGNAIQSRHSCSKTHQENNMHYDKSHSEHLWRNHRQNAEDTCILLCPHVIFLALIYQWHLSSYRSLGSEHSNLELFYVENVLVWCPPPTRVNHYNKSWETGPKHHRHIVLKSLPHNGKTICPRSEFTWDQGRQWANKKGTQWGAHVEGLISSRHSCKTWIIDYAERWHEAVCGSGDREHSRQSTDCQSEWSLEQLGGKKAGTQSRLLAWAKR